jgi:hypothetical protein
MLLHDFHYDLSYFEGLIPYEREIYLSLLIEKLQNDKAKQA